MYRSAQLCLAILLFCSSATFGQQWSPAQQEVWQTVETYWQLYASGDADGFLSYLHEDFSGWTNTNAMPRDKEDMARYLPHGFENSETVLYDVEPVGITVHGDVAIVHYYYSRTFVDSNGREASDAGRWTDVLKRDNGRWVMIGDHGGSDGR